MARLEATRFKLSEAQFFYGKLQEVSGRVVRNYPEAFQYYLSAFLSAGRSVGFALQAENKALYDAWYPSWEASLSHEQVALLRNFNKERVATVRKTGANIEHQVVPISGQEYLLAAATEGEDIQISGPVGVPLPEFQKVVRTFAFGGSDAEVVLTAGAYLLLIQRCVAEFAAQFSDAPAA